MYFALDLPAGSEIMVPTYTFFATCLAMRFFGYVPIFIDIDPKPPASISTTPGAS